MVHEKHAGEAGPAVLELGRDVGAAVVYAPAALDRAEIEIRPCGRAWDGTHTAVRRRPGQPPVFAALFFSLRAGTYDVKVRGTDRFRTITVVGGRVTEEHMT